MGSSVNRNITKPLSVLLYNAWRFFHFVEIIFKRLDTEYKPRVILDISGSPIEKRWGSRKYPGWLYMYVKARSNANMDPITAMYIEWTIL